VAPPGEANKIVYRPRIGLGYRYTEAKEIVGLDNWIVEWNIYRRFTMFATKCRWFRVKYTRYWYAFTNACCCLATGLLNGRKVLVQQWRSIALLLRYFFCLSVYPNTISLTRAKHWPYPCVFIVWFYICLLVCHDVWILSWFYLLISPFLKCF